MKPHKYSAIKTDCAACGKPHPSKKEARRCADLHMLQRGGAIGNLTTQAPFLLFGPSGLPLMTEGREGGTHRKQIRMTWDFRYEDRGAVVVEDSKGVQTTDFKLRLALFRACYPDVRVVLS